MKNPHFAGSPYMEWPSGYGTSQPPMHGSSCFKTYTTILPCMTRFE